MAEHIDRNRLSHDLRYHFEYLSKFLNFTQNDIDILNHIAPSVLPKLPTVIEQIYTKLHSFDITHKYFTMRNDGFENFHVNKTFCTTLASAQTDYRKDMLGIYFQNVLTQKEWSDTFLQYLSRVGEIHTTKGGATSINVDYIHINLLLSLLENSFINIIWQSENIDRYGKLDILQTINKFFWIQNSFFTMHYILTPKDKVLSNVPIVKISKCCFP